MYPVHQSGLGDTLFKRPFLPAVRPRYDQLHVGALIFKRVS